MTAAPVIVSPSWPAPRENADGEVRSTDFVEAVQRPLPPGDWVVIQDLGPIERHDAPPGPAGPAATSVAVVTAERSGEPLTLLSTYVR